VGTKRLSFSVVFAWRKTQKVTDAKQEEDNCEKKLEVLHKMFKVFKKT
jgi:hypothetical protein